MALGRSRCQAIKKPSPLPARVLVSSSGALLPIPSSISPPGAGNEYEYALKTKLDGANKAEKGYFHDAEVVGGNLHAAAVRRDGDGDVAAALALEQTHVVLRSVYYTNSQRSGVWRVYQQRSTFAPWADWARGMVQEVSPAGATGWRRGGDPGP